jgi:hypothetical protein
MHLHHHVTVKVMNKAKTTFNGEDLHVTQKLRRRLDDKQTNSLLTYAEDLHVTQKLNVEDLHKIYYKHIF